MEEKQKYTSIDITKSALLSDFLISQYVADNGNTLKIKYFKKGFTHK